MALAAALGTGAVFILVGLWRPGAAGRGEGQASTAPNEFQSLQKKAEAAEKLLKNRPAPPLEKSDLPAGHRVFVAPLLLFFPDRAEEPVQSLDPELKTSDKILVRWKLAYGFDIEDPGVAGQDEDSDGFTNREEFEAGTNPVDSQSTPAKWIKLRLQSFDPVELQVSFVAKAPDRITLRFRVGAKMEDFNLSMGQSFWVGAVPQQVKIWKEESQAQSAVEQGSFPHLLPFRLKDYREDRGERFEPKTKSMNSYNDSYVILERKDGLDGELKILINDATRTQGGLLLNLGLTRLVPLVPGEVPLGPFQPGQTFSYGGDSYLLQDASSQQAKLKILAANKEIVVLPATP